MPQQLLSLWTVAADDVTRGANASEEVHADCRRGASGGDIGQVNVYADFSARGRLRAWDRRDSGSADTNYGYVYLRLKNTKQFSILFTFYASYLDWVRILLVLNGGWRKAFEWTRHSPSGLHFGSLSCFSLSLIFGRPQ